MATSTSCPTYEDILNDRFCLENISKDGRGRLVRTHVDEQKCDHPKCVTLKTVHTLELDVKSGPCDSSLGKQFDGTFIVEKLASALQDDGHGRGCHAGDFQWKGKGVFAVGEVTGTTNVGTLRKDVFDACEKCHEPGVMKGVFCGYIKDAERDELRGCRIKGSYRIAFDPSRHFQDTGITGVIEGFVICPCKR